MEAWWISPSAVYDKEPCGLDKMHMTMAEIDERQKLDGEFIR